MLKLSDLLPLVHGEFKVIIHKLHDVPHTLGSGFDGMFWEDVAVDNMVVSRITHGNNILAIEVFEDRKGSQSH